LKAKAVVNRSEVRDSTDLLWILQKMEIEEQQFERLDVQELFGEVMDSMESIGMNEEEGAELRRLPG